MANKFDYTGYDPSVDDVVFDALNYPDPTSETEVRKQLSAPLLQLKDFINDELFDGEEINIENIPLLDNATPNASPDTIVKRGSDGKFRINPTMPFWDSTEVVNKYYVDTKTSDLDSATSSATASTLAKRDANGRLAVASPVDDGDVVNKEYLESVINDLLEQLQPYLLPEIDSPFDEGAIAMVVGGKWVKGFRHGETS